MTGIRDIKRAARSQLHEHMSEGVLYVPKDGDPFPVTARLHTSYSALGELAKGFAERYELEPRAIFLAAEVSPGYGDFIVTQDLGAFVVEAVHPPDDITVKVELARLTSGQIVSQGWDPNADWLGLTVG